MGRDTDAAGGGRRRRNVRNHGSRKKTSGMRAKSAGAEKLQCGQCLRHWHLAIHRRWSRTRRFVTDRFSKQTIPKHDCCMLRCGWPSGLPVTPFWRCARTTRKNPPSKHLCIFSWWLRCWCENSELHQPVHEAWKRALSVLRVAKCRWRRVNGPMTNVIATLMDFRWTHTNPTNGNRPLETGGITRAVYSPASCKKWTSA